MPRINEPQPNILDYPSPTRSRFREAVIILVNLKTYHTPYETNQRDGMLIVNNTTAFDIILKDLRFGKILRIKATGGCSEENPVNIYPPEGKTIDGEEVLTLTQPYSSVILVSDEAGWLIF